MEPKPKATIEELVLLVEYNIISISEARNELGMPPTQWTVEPNTQRIKLVLDCAGIEEVIARLSAIVSKLAEEETA